jgi:NADH-quinone oxidoreductase subunit I
MAKKYSLTWIAQRVWSGIGSLLKGMSVTLRYFLDPRTVVTQQYPENKATLKMPERYRARLSMQHDENGFHKCTGCRICEQACPNGSIKVMHRPTPSSGRAELDSFLWRMDSCTYCNACVLACPFMVLKMDGAFESAAYDRRVFVCNLSRYAGPTSTALNKITDSVERTKMVEPRSPYSGPVPMLGEDWPGLKGLTENKERNGSPKPSK